MWRIEEARKKAPLHWIDMAEKWHRAIIHCQRVQDVHPDVLDGMRGIALELALKACLVAEVKDLCETHDLSKLAGKLDLAFDRVENRTLKFFSDWVEWKSRYPGPTNSGYRRTDEREKHYKRVRGGKISNAIKEMDEYREKYEILYGKLIGHASKEHERNNIQIVKKQFPDIEPPDIEPLDVEPPDIEPYDV